MLPECSFSSFHPPPTHISQSQIRVVNTDPTAEVYLEPSRTSEMELFAKRVDGSLFRKKYN